MSVSVANGVRAVAVLVVEDDFFVRCDIAGCLREAGYAVIETENGEDAIALCKSGMTIDMVFTDINLSGTGNRMGCGYTLSVGATRYPGCLHVWPGDRLRALCPR